MGFGIVVLLVYEIKVSPYIWWNWDSTSIFLCYFSSFFSFITLHLLFSQCGSAFQCKKHPAYSNRLKSNCILMCVSFPAPFHLHMFAFYHFTGCNRKCENATNKYMVTDRDIHICKPRAFSEWIGKMELLCKNDWINDEHAIYRFGSHNKHFLAMNKNKTTHKRTTHIQEATKQCVLYFCYWKLAINVVCREKEKKKAKQAHWLRFKYDYLQDLNRQRY